MKQLQTKTTGFMIKKFGATLNNFQAFRAKFLKKILSQQGYQSVLDLGSGDGSIQIYLRSELKGVSFTVSDSSPAVIEYLISKGFNCLDIDLDRHAKYLLRMDWIRFLPLKRFETITYGRHLPMKLHPVTSNIPKEE